MLTSQRFDPNSKYRVLSHRGIAVPGPVNHINQGEEVPTGLLNSAIMFGLFCMGDIEPILAMTAAPIPPDEEDDDDDYSAPIAAAVPSVATAQPVRRVRRQSRR